MSPSSVRPSSLRDRVASRWDALSSTFGFFAGVAMLMALVVGFGLPAIDELLEVRLPLFDFDTNDSARSLLETVATVTVAVAGLSFSVTIVAFTLTATQLSPRVLRTFRADRISQVTLACFLGTFIYCLVVLVRLGSTSTVSAPNLAITLAIVLAFTSFALFALFIGHVVEMLQPSRVIAGIVDDAASTAADPFPAGAGEAPSDAVAARAAVDARTARPGREVHAEGEGYLSEVWGGEVIACAAERDALVVQRMPLGDYVVRGDVLAEVWCDDDAFDAVAARVRGCFALQRQRSPVQDVAFPIRQLADIALKGLSPGINDPTTAENAMGALTSVLVRWTETDPPDPLRTDEQDVPRLVASVPQLDDLVRLGFEQVRVCAADSPVVAVRLLALLQRIRDAAIRTGRPYAEVERQAHLLADGTDGEVPTSADEELVRAAYEETHTMGATRRQAPDLGSP